MPPQIVPLALNTHLLPNGAHTVRARVVYGAADVVFSAPLAVVVDNPQVNIYSADTVPDDWEVKRISKGHGRATEISLRVNADITVRINGEPR